jgi:hypothetical protein
MNIRARFEIRPNPENFGKWTVIDHSSGEWVSEGYATHAEALVAMSQAVAAASSLEPAPRVAEDTAKPRRAKAQPKPATTEEQAQ